MKVNDSRIIMLYEYCFRVRAKYENDFIQSYNNSFFNKKPSSEIFQNLADIKHDSEIVNEITSNILYILNMNVGGE